MDTRGTNFKPVAMMQYACDEAEKMEKLNAIWVQTMDLKHLNLLVYPLDIMVEEIAEVCQRKYVDMDEFIPYEVENGSHWLISKTMQLQDMDAFFKTYLHEDEMEVA